MRSHLREYWWFWLMIVVKIAIHIYAASLYGFHRDEYLYLVQSEHLAWGYLEVPPMIAAVAWLIRNLAGDAIIAIKSAPMLCGMINMGLTLLITKSLGGKQWAQFIAVFIYLISPSFLRSNHLFQPVCFNHLCWLTLSYLLICLVQTKREQYWIWIGITCGIGFLTKYSILFLAFASLAGILLSKHRSIFISRAFPAAVMIAICIALPNIIWQYQHQFPVLAHMRELAETQLVHVRPVDFFNMQFLMQFGGSLVWIAGLITLLFSTHMVRFRFLGYTFIILIALLFFLSGKPYYTLGIYPILFAAGGVGLEKWIRQRSMRITIPLLCFLANLIVIPYGLPLLQIDEMRRYGISMRDKFGIEGPLRWENGRIYDLPQDYADMFGWEELAPRVAGFYHTLPEDIKKRCNIFGGSYGHASAINFYRHKYALPEIYTLNGSHVLWIPDTLRFDRQIRVEDVRRLSSPYFKNVQLIDSIHNPYARDPGYILYRTGPIGNVDSTFYAIVNAERKRFNRQDESGTTDR